MCLISLQWQTDPDYSLILAANRDEFHARPTKAATWWQDHPDILGGQDCKAGGTWMAVHRSGRWAAVTNYREPHPKTDGLSRGLLITDYLLGQADPQHFAESMQGEQYAGFNLLLGTPDSIHYCSNRNTQAAQTLATGNYALSNALLDTPWPKVCEIREQAVGHQTEQLLQALQSTRQPPDADLPQTGVGPEIERLVAPIFIQSPAYGTRASTLLRIQNNGKIDFTEQRYDSAGLIVGKDTFEFMPNS